MYRQFSTQLFETQTQLDIEDVAHVLDGQVWQRWAVNLRVNEQLAVAGVASYLSDVLGNLRWWLGMSRTKRQFLLLHDKYACTWEEVQFSAWLTVSVGTGAENNTGLATFTKIRIVYDMKIAITEKSDMCVFRITGINARRAVLYLGNSDCGMLHTGQEE